MYFGVILKLRLPRFYGVAICGHARIMRGLLGGAPLSVIAEYVKSQARPGS